MNIHFHYCVYRQLDKYKQNDQVWDMTENNSDYSTTDDSTQSEVQDEIVSTTETPNSSDPIASQILSRFFFISCEF